MAGSPDRISNTYTPEEQEQFENDIETAKSDQTSYRDRISSGDRIPTTLAEELGDLERARTGL
jgi:hypothetical protein